jgi:peptidoglycan/xylan/chitin deacetylase (PgdA/CDA1 family)
LPKKSVLITIDDGHYETYHVAYPILKKYNLKATSFVIGSRVTKKTPKYNPNSRTRHSLGEDVMKKIAKEYPNLEFQSHSYNLHKRTGSGNGVVKYLSKKRIAQDFKKNAKFGFSALAWPFGHTSRNSLAVAKSDKSIKVAFGYMMDHPASRKSALYNIPRFKVFGDRGLSDFVRIVSTAR